MRDAMDHKRSSSLAISSSMIADDRKCAASIRHRATIANASSGALRHGVPRTAERDHTRWIDRVARRADDPAVRPRKSSRHPRIRDSRENYQFG
jgi:hypothetical protein